MNKLFLLLATLSLWASQPERTIVALYNSENPSIEDATLNLIHQTAEMPLNHLGYILHYHDIAKGLPPASMTKGARAILTWFTEAGVPQPEEFLDWATSMVDEGKRFLICGNLGFTMNSATKEMVDLNHVNRFLQRLGLLYYGIEYETPYALEILEQNPEIMGFERAIDIADIPDIAIVESISPDNEVYLKMGLNKPGSRPGAAVVVTPRGGYFQGNCALYLELRTGSLRWMINPFLYFARALGREQSPTFDTTTLFGRRLFWSHIDGDGYRSATKIKGFRNCGDVIYQTVLKEYDLPITVSFISAEVNPKQYGNTSLVKLAQEIMALPNVRPAAHGFTHPLVWKEKITVFEIPDYSEGIDIDPDDPEWAGLEGDFNEAALVIVPMNEYLKSETVDACQYITDHITPDDRPVRINLWTGDCQPPGEAIRFCDQAGLYNMNGGDTRMDSTYPTYTAVAPLTRQADGYIQIYTGDANENIYTEGWKAPHNRFLNVIQTMKQTEYPTFIPKAKPRRVAPINIYYHFYLGEYRESLDSLHTIYKYALSQPLISIDATDYCEIVYGFLDGTIHKRDDGYDLANYGACRTIRIPKALGYPDLAKSQNILGFKEWEDQLYIHLGEETAHLVLTDQRPTTPYLQEASVILTDLQITDQEIAFNATSYAGGQAIFANIGPSLLTIDVEGGQQNVSFEIHSPPSQ